MLFNSINFIFIFLPICLLGFYTCARWYGARAGLQSLVVASLAFYAFPGLYYLLLLLISTVVNYWLGRSLQSRPSGWLLGLSVFFNLAALGYYKYANFLIDNLNFFASGSFPHWNVILPIGISFFTFQQISYLVDSHKQLLKTDGFQEYLLFVAFFPQLIAGPIVRFQELAPQFSQPDFGAFHWDNFGRGFILFAIGLCKKVLLADTLAQMATPVFGQADAGIEISQAEAWKGLLSYSLQIYFDFSAYSDMAIGLGLMLGLRLPENFLSPYKAHNIIEFWRRWHITLSRFLKDYLYVPFGGNKRGEMRRSVNLLLVMLIGGLWHGAHWNFVIWGGLHGFYLMLNHFKIKYFPSKNEVSGVTRAVNVLLTFLLVMIAWAFFRAETLVGALNILGSLTSISGSHFLYEIFRISMLPLVPYFLLVWLCPNSMELMQKLEPVLADRDHLLAKASIAVVSAMGLSVCFFYIFSGSYSEFIYFQF